jgi:hypothetical protein
MHVLCSAARAARPRGVFIQASAGEQLCVVGRQGTEGLAMYDEHDSHIYADDGLFFSGLSGNKADAQIVEQAQRVKTVAISSRLGSS